ncbi:MAG: hypothetical protein WC843_00925 [Candidatus Gracilibacteria bacterium]|jgi:hypothetical protein
MSTRNLQFAESNPDRSSGEHSLPGDGANVFPILNDKNAFTANEQVFFEDTSYLDKYAAGIDLQQYVQGENKADGIRNFTRDGRAQAIETAKELRAVALEGLTAEELKLINEKKESSRNFGAVGKIASKVRDAITGLKLPSFSKRAGRAAGLGLLLSLGAIATTQTCGNHGGSGGSGPTSAVTAKASKDAGTDAQAKDASADVSDAGDAASSVEATASTDAGVATSASSVASVAAAPSASPSTASTAPASKTAAKSVPSAKFGTGKSHSSAPTSPALAKSVSMAGHTSKNNASSSRPSLKPESTGPTSTGRSATGQSLPYYNFRYNRPQQSAQKNAGSVAQAKKSSEPGAAYYDFSKNASRTAQKTAGAHTIGTKSATSGEKLPVALPKVSTRPAELDRPGVPPKSHQITAQRAYEDAFAKIQRTKLYKQVEDKMASVPTNLHAKVQSALKEAKINETPQGRVVDPNETVHAVIRSFARATHENLALNTIPASYVQEPGQPSQAMMTRVRDAINMPAAGHLVGQAQNTPGASTSPATVSAKAPTVANTEAPKTSTATANLDSNNAAKVPTLHKRHKLSGNSPASSVSATPATPTSNSFGSREGNFTTVDSDSNTPNTTVSGSTIENGKTQTAPNAEKVSNHVEKDPYSNLKSQTEQRIRAGEWFGQESITVTAADGTRFTATVKKAGGADQYTIFWREAK